MEKAHEAKVKGKSEPLIIYKVHGYFDEHGKEVIVKTPYSSYKAEKSDKVVHDKPKGGEVAQAGAAPSASAEPAAQENHHPVIADEGFDGEGTLPGAEAHIDRVIDLSGSIVRTEATPPPFSYPADREVTPPPFTHTDIVVGIHEKKKPEASDADSSSDDSDDSGEDGPGSKVA